MEEEKKNTRWSSVDRIIRKILLDYYTSSKSWEVQQKFVEQTFSFNDASLTQQINDWLEWKVEPWTKLNLNWLAEWYTENYFHDLIDLEHPIEWNIDVASFYQIARLFQIGIPVKEIKDKYEISYETIKNRVEPFFNVKIINNGKAHSKYFFLKPEVYSALSYYLAIDKHFKKEWDYYRKIYKLFSKKD